MSEPAADLAVATSLASSLSGISAPSETVVFGEISLSGEIRPVSHTDARLKEATKLGFTHAIVPKNRSKNKGATPKSKLKIREVEHLAELLSLFNPPTKRTKDNGHVEGKYNG